MRLLRIWRILDGELFPRENPHIRVFQRKKDGKFFQVTIPMSRILGDYEEAMYQAADSVSVCERKLVCRVVQHLASQSRRQGR